MTLNTAFLLMAQYNGKAIIPLADLCRDYFSHLTASSQSSPGYLPLLLSVKRRGCAVFPGTIAGRNSRPKSIQSQRMLPQPAKIVPPNSDRQISRTSRPRRRDDPTMVPEAPLKTPVPTRRSTIACPLRRR